MFKVEFKLSKLVKSIVLRCFRAKKAVYCSEYTLCVIDKVNKHLSKKRNIYIYIYIYMCVYIYHIMSYHIYVCIYMYIYMHIIYMIYLSICVKEIKICKIFEIYGWIFFATNDFSFTTWKLPAIQSIFYTNIFIRTKALIWAKKLRTK